MHPPPSIYIDGEASEHHHHHEQAHIPKCIQNERPQVVHHFERMKWNTRSLQRYTRENCENNSIKNEFVAFPAANIQSSFSIAWRILCGFNE